MDVASDFGVIWERVSMDIDIVILLKVIDSIKGENECLSFVQ